MILINNLKNHNLNQMSQIKPTLVLFITGLTLRTVNVFKISLVITKFSLKHIVKYV